MQIIATVSLLALMLIASSVSAQEARSITADDGPRSGAQSVATPGPAAAPAPKPAPQVQLTAAEQRARIAAALKAAARELRESPMPWMLGCKDAGWKVTADWTPAAGLTVRCEL